MPNIITHTIFCEEVLNKISNHKYKEIIKKHIEEYRIGTNGPDFLFFHGTFPLYKKNTSALPTIGGVFHREKINLFYETAIQCYHKHKDSELKDSMAAYLIGHYLHWQLDSIMHPYVVYRTGFKEPLSMYYHHRFESMMDTILLKKYRNTSIKNFKTYQICKRSKFSYDAVSNIYLPCIKACQNKNISYKNIQEALQDWEKAQRYLYDPYSVKYRILKVYEMFNRTPWLYSGNIVRPKIDTKYDIINKKHKVWKHPCKEEQYSNSVYDLMDQAIVSATLSLPYLFEALDHKSIQPLLNHIDNKTYNNGINENLERIHKDVIYKK